MEVLFISIFALLGFIKAIVDISAHGKYNRSVIAWVFPDKQQFWDNKVSWKNKYKDLKTKQPKFFLSTTLLVLFTDSWHLFEAIGRIILFATLWYIFTLELDSFLAIYCHMSYIACFHVSYHYLLMQKTYTRFKSK